RAARRLLRSGARQPGAGDHRATAGSIAANPNAAEPQKRRAPPARAGAAAAMTAGASESLFQDRTSALEYLKSLSSLGDAPWPIGEAALALASLDRPQVALARYREHLATLARDLGAAAIGAAEAAAR